LAPGETLSWLDLVNRFISQGKTVLSAQRLARNAFHQLDRDRNWRLSADEINGLLPGLREESADAVVDDAVAGIEILFRSLDLNGDERLTYYEIVNALILAGKPMVKAQSLAQTVFQNLGRNLQERLTFEEALANLPHNGCEPPSPRDSTSVALMKRFRDAFTALDENRDQVLSWTEIKRGFEQCGRTQPDAETLTDVVFSRLDRNRDGQISWDEALASLSNR
jgi:Ca2+-binding EF-hand superfamily protein